MDQTALKFINDRQALLRDAYNSYRSQFSAAPAPSALKYHHPNGSTSSSGEKRVWAWGRWSDDDVDDVIRDCLEKERNTGGDPAGQGSNDNYKFAIRRWVEDFLDDTGSMFRLYRKSGFDTNNAIVTLRDTLKFRFQHRRELLWSPISPHKTNTKPLYSPKDVISSANLSSLDTLIQLYPHSSTDPNRRPIIVVSLKHLGSISDSIKGPENTGTSPVAPPKTQALAAFERLRCHLAASASTNDQDGWKQVDPLQFILIIDLAGGQVSVAAWDIVKWLVRDGADQFHGMCSAVFVVNYSWEFGAIWSFIKRVLPAPAKARVTFPRPEELLEYLGEDTLPPSLGGSCTSILPYSSSPLMAPEIPLSATVEVSLSHSTQSRAPNGRSSSVPPPTPFRPTHTRHTSLKHLDSTSRENPYYGYPAIMEEDSKGRPVRIQHSRRRKRDLAKTLMWLLLLRSKERISNVAWQLRKLGWKLKQSRWSTLVFLIVIILLVSLRGVRQWRLWLPRLRLHILGSVT